VGSSKFFYLFTSKSIKNMATSQSKLVNGARQYDSLTANGAVSHSTSLDACLDLFFLAGASRRMSESDMIQVFERARLENLQLAYKILFWARDCRGGAGEKRFFQVIGKHCFTNHLSEWEQISVHIPEYGYWKDLFKIETPTVDAVDWVIRQLDESDNANLLAKWFPRKGPWFASAHKYLGVSPKHFRKALVEKTKVIESQMCNKEWSAIDYSKVPSVAMNMYRNAFEKQDRARFNLFIICCIKQLIGERMLMLSKLSGNLYQTTWKVVRKESYLCVTYPVQ
jgi:hypothetical protein